jgi:hypothetical protein
MNRAFSQDFLDITPNGVMSKKFPCDSIVGDKFLVRFK